MHDNAAACNSLANMSLCLKHSTSKHAIMSTKLSVQCLFKHRSKFAVGEPIEILSASVLELHAYLVSAGVAH